MKRKICFNTDLELFDKWLDLLKIDGMTISNRLNILIKKDITDLEKLNKK